MESIDLHISIHADAENIFAALTEPHLLKRWFTADLIAVPMQGTTAAFAIGTLNFKMQLKEMIPAKKLLWHCVDGNVDWVDSEILFTLTEENKRTLLHFQQSRLSETAKLALWTASWDNYLNQLKELCEKQALN